MHCRAVLSDSCASRGSDWDSGMGMQDMAIDGNTITTLIAIGGPVGAVFGLGWWLSGRFRKIENIQRTKVEELAEIQRRQLQAHEDRDQERHEENLDRFQKQADRGQARHEENLERFRTISVSLAKLGAANGSGHG